VYHADVNDAQKERLHVKWRSGEIRVVCATIGTGVTHMETHRDDQPIISFTAFGLGIDKVYR
jgi:superfamily II DNA helicase RecQ